MNKSVTLVPSFSFEGWRSMEIYAQQIYEGLRFSDRWEGDVKMLKTSHAEDPSLLERLNLKYLKYPNEIQKEVEKLGGVGVIHHTDHGYAHLIRSNQMSVVTVHDLTHYEYPWLPKHSLYLWKKRMEMLKKADHLVAVTQNVADLLTSHLGISARKITVNYHELKVEGFLALDREVAKNKWAKKLKKDSSDLLVASIGMDSPKKNLEVTLRAVLECRKAGVDVKLVRMGAHFKREITKALAKELYDQDALIELGYISHESVAEVLSICDVLSFPSKYEGFGMPIMEAQAIDVPVVIADASCLPEVAGENAPKHAPDDYKELASILSNLMKDSSSRNSLIEEGRSNIKRFAPGKHIKTLEEVYDGVLRQ